MQSNQMAPPKQRLPQPLGGLEPTHAQGRDGAPGLLQAQGESLPPMPATPLNHTDWRSGATLLLVEDDAQVRRFVADILHVLGYRVLEAADGIEAMRMHEEHEGPIHVLLTDLLMPHMDGPELARLLLAARPSLRIIYMSGYGFDVIARRPLRVGEEEFIAKPFTMRTLLETLVRSGTANVHDRAICG